MSLFSGFIEAITQLTRRKVLLPKDYYAKHPAVARSRAFTVSGLAALAQIEQVLDSLTKSVQARETFGQWKTKALADVPALDSLPKGRLSTIYRNAIQNAYNAGRYEQMRANKRNKYWLYDGVIDGRTSDICRALDGKIYPADSPVWRTIHPPNHHNCRSTVIGLTEAQAKARGYRPGTPDVIPQDGTPEPGWDTNPAIGLDDALRAAAAAGNAAIGRQYVPAPLNVRDALVGFGRYIVGAPKSGGAAAGSIVRLVISAIADALGR